MLAEINGPLAIREMDVKVLKLEYSEKKLYNVSF